MTGASAQASGKKKSPEKAKKKKCKVVEADARHAPTNNLHAEIAHKSDEDDGNSDEAAASWVAEFTAAQQHVDSDVEFDMPALGVMDIFSRVL